MNLPQNIRYLAIEGVIGVGKTTLARMLCKRWNELLEGQCPVELLEERFDENPFLPKFYKNPTEYAFQTQLFFLISRGRDLRENAVQGDLFRHLLVSDYTFDKDRLFALQNLDDAEFSLYETVAKALETTLPRPDFIVYLQGSVNTLLRRIKGRNREMERFIGAEYLEDLQEHFDHYFWHYGDCPVLIINTDNIDFVNNEKHFQMIAEKIESWPSCTTYFAPQG